MFGLPGRRLLKSFSKMHGRWNGDLAPLDFEIGQF